MCYMRLATHSSLSVDEIPSTSLSILKLVSLSLPPFKLIFPSTFACLIFADNLVAKSHDASCDVIPSHPISSDAINIEHFGVGDGVVLSTTWRPD